MAKRGLTPNVQLHVKSSYYFTNDVLQIKGKEMKYFLDHPQIKRKKALGNGSKPSKGLKKSVEKLEKMHKKGSKHMEETYEKEDKESD